MNLMDLRVLNKADKRILGFSSHNESIRSTIKDVSS